jgi:hypothetical protein
MPAAGVVALAFIFVSSLGIVCSFLRSCARIYTPALGNAQCQTTFPDPTSHVFISMTSGRPWTIF